MKNPPYTKDVDLHYIDYKTGKILETVKMREYYEYDTKRQKYNLVRSHVLTLQKPNGDLK